MMYDALSNQENYEYMVHEKTEYKHSIINGGGGLSYVLGYLNI